MSIYKSLSEFMYYTTIAREDKTAKIIVAHDENNDKPIYLIGFSSASIFSDLEIYELAYKYYNDLIKELKNLNLEE